MTEQRLCLRFSDRAAVFFVDLAGRFFDAVTWIEDGRNLYINDFNEFHHESYEYEYFFMCKVPIRNLEFK